MTEELSEFAMTEEVRLLSGLHSSTSAMVKGRSGVRCRLIGIGVFAEVSLFTFCHC